MTQQDNNTYPVSTPYDIFRSANGRNKSDNCIAIHRPDLTKHKVEIHVQKIRFKNNGMPGKIKMVYD
jgi:hypothetical protein